MEDHKETETLDGSAFTDTEREEKDESGEEPAEVSLGNPVDHGWSWMIVLGRQKNCGKATVRGTLPTCHCTVLDQLMVEKSAGKLLFLLSIIEVVAAFILDSERNCHLCWTD